MPELPEVGIMRRGIASVAGCTIADFRRPASRLQPIEMSPGLRSFRHRVVGRKIIAVGRWANALSLLWIRATALSSNRACLDWSPW